LSSTAPPCFRHGDARPCAGSFRPGPARAGRGGAAVHPKGAAAGLHPTPTHPRAA